MCWLKNPDPMLVCHKCSVPSETRLSPGSVDSKLQCTYVSAPFETHLYSIHFYAGVLGNQGPYFPFPIPLQTKGQFCLLLSFLQLLCLLADVQPTGIHCYYYLGTKAQGCTKPCIVMPIPCLDK